MTEIFYSGFVGAYASLEKWVFTWINNVPYVWLLVILELLVNLLVFASPVTCDLGLNQSQYDCENERDNKRIII